MTSGPIVKKTARDLDGKLSQKASAALDNCKTYFNKGDCLIKRIRNEVEYHSDRDVMKPVVEKGARELGEIRVVIPDEHPSFFCETSWKFYSDALCSLTAHPDADKALEELFADIKGPLTWLSDFAHDIVSYMISGFVVAETKETVLDSEDVGEAGLLYFRNETRSLAGGGGAGTDGK